MEPKDFPVGARVRVFSMGVHKGVVVEHNPVVNLPISLGVWEIKRCEGWVRVRLDDDRDWNGTPDHLDLIAASSPAVEA